ncbi:MAG TPA: hypothetical protein VGC55_05175 [Dokdonella sp.]
MRMPSTLGLLSFVAGVWLAGAGAAEARTLRASATRIESAQANVRNLQIAVTEHANGSATLHLDADDIAVPKLALAGRLGWSCPLLREDDGTRSCHGPVHLANGGTDKSAELGVRIDSRQTELSLTRDGSSIGLTLPFAAAEPIVAALRRVPADWLAAPLAQAWKGGELRRGVFDGGAKLHGDGRIEAAYRLDELAFNTRDGVISGDGLVAEGTLDSEPGGGDTRLIASTTLSGGTLHAGVASVVLPQTPIEANLDLVAHANGRWDIARFAWRDAEALVLEASGQFDPAALAPLRALDLRIERAVFPIATQRYAKSVLAAQGLGALALKGELSGECSIDESGVQQLTLATTAFDATAGHFAVSGIRGGVDWARSGVRPARAFAWKSARFDGYAVPAISSDWQSRDGEMHLQGHLRSRLLGGELTLTQTVLRPLATEGERLRSGFALSGLGYDSADGTIAAARIKADGNMHVSGGDAALRIELSASLSGGEALAGPLYVKLPPTPVRTTLDATYTGTQVQIHAFDWDDADALAFHASGEIAPAEASPVHALQVELRKARLGPAIERYARSWLASKGYAQMSGSGEVSAALKFDRDGLQRFAFDAKAVDLRDGGGRFAFAGIDGGVDWEFHRDTPATTLGWQSIELFRIPLGGARAALEARSGAIVLAQPLSVGVLGGQVRLEKLSLQPRSPRGDRYAGSFALVGLDMPQISAVLGWPKFPGSLSGGIPEVEFAGDSIELHGGLDLYVFDGHLGVSGLTLERPFGVAPSLGADIHFENFDLEQLTSAFSLGGMSGRLDGTIGGLRLVDWSPVALDAWLRTRGGGRMSYKAVNDITSIGGGGGLSANLQTMALQIFDTFGYRALGIRCRLIDEVCLMSGIDPLPTQAANVADADGYTIVDGSGVPRIRIVGHRRRVDWPTVVRRLRESMQGQGPIIK